MDYPKRCRKIPLQRLSVGAVRAQARRRAALLRDVPREDIVLRFRKLAEGIHQEAIAKGTAVEGDWRGD